MSQTVRIEDMIKPRQLPGACRESVKDLLKDIYGYVDFRELEIYNDLTVNKEKLTVSQGLLIEKVIDEAERSLSAQLIDSKDSSTNIMLTAPTGSGKSLLFQLPGIYLGRAHGTLTIVVSPLKALIEDQVESLLSYGYDKVAYASSDLSPEEKSNVYNKVKNQEVDLFYLSPELLLSYDIHHFIGERHIGLMVIDEAHTVTTWGKEFRVDYWFLGRYLAHLKDTLGYHFPIFALTATAVWNPSGSNDMVLETIRSLHMTPCELYVGTVRRKNIGFSIRKVDIQDKETYDKAKQRQIFERVQEYLRCHKTLLYYPFASGIDQRIKAWVSPGSWNLVATYYGKKDKEQKAEIVESFKNGSKRLIVATKAFGMGVDVRDIDRVYHVAPSSTFVDYIQEIGRSGRDANIRSIAATDFHERDFYYMKRLHVLGNISQEQLAKILGKLIQVYQMKGGKKDMLVSLGDFEFAVKIPRTRNKLEYESELGQIVKTALLWIEDDLEQRYGEKLLEVTPQNLLTKGYIQDKTGSAFAQQFADYLESVEGQADIYSVQLGRLWEERFPEMGFKDFKQHLSNGTLLEGARAVLVGKHEVQLQKDASEIKEHLIALFRDLKKLLALKLYTSKGRFDESELQAVFQQHNMDVRSAKHFITSLLESRTEEGRSVSLISSQKKKDSNELSFTVSRGFDLLLERYQKLFIQRITGEKGSLLTFYCTPFSDLNMLLNLLSMLGGISFTTEGGGTPCVHIRLNNPQDLVSLVQNSHYTNKVLEMNEQIFNDQIELFTMFFGNTDLTDEQRWDFIEDYFTGSDIETLRNKYL